MEEEINNISETTEAEETVGLAKRPERHHRKPDDGKGRFFMLRQIFNILFMVIGIIGAYMYFKGNEAMGIVVFIIAMAFKMAECALRFVKK
jgi:hypothetical protein